MNDLLRLIPAVHELQHEQSLIEMQKVYKLSDEKMTEFIRVEIDNIRNEILDNNSILNSESKIKEELIKALIKRIEKSTSNRLRRVINATGTVLHTNFGRARLSERALEHILETAKNYSNLEYNIENGVRGSRHEVVEELLKEITGAEAALVVNNNAAAVYFILRCFAKNKDVVVSRGELVEIGGSFRVSSIMEESDANLIEVGTTNKTHLRDYSHKLTEQTAMILKVHTSNFKIIGFTKSVSRHELVDLANKENVVYYEDLGSGALYDFSKHGIGDEPLIKSVIKEGAHLVSFSGDKLLGGPQAGIIAGKKELIDKLKQHQLARVLRVDKLTLAGLEATLKIYANNCDDDLKSIPVIRDILKPLEELQEQSLVFIERTKSLLSFQIQLLKETSMIGGGTLPGVKIDTFGVSVRSKLLSTTVLEKKLRLNNPSVIGRIIKDRLFFDFRTLHTNEIDELYDILCQLDKQLHIM